MGSSAQSAVMKSLVCTARSATTFVGAAVAHHADALHRQEDGEGLAVSSYQLLPLASIVERSSSMKIASARAAAPRTRASPRRGYARPAPDPGTDGGRPSRAAGRGRRRAAHLVLEQLAQRLEQLQAIVSGRPPTLWWLLMLVAFFVFAPPDSITSGRSCPGQTCRVGGAFRLALEHLDELAADDLALGLGVGRRPRARPELRARVDVDHLRVQAPANISITWRARSGAAGRCRRRRR